MSSEKQMLKGALIPSISVGAILLIASTFSSGHSGFVGAMLAQVIVLIFFASHLFVSKISRNADPMTTMALAMGSYFVKLLIFGVFLLLVTRLVSPEVCDRTAFGVSAIASTFAWLGGEIRAYFKLKTHLQLPGSK